MRELLLRVEAKRVGAPGKSGPSTVYFRERQRRMLLRHPYFAIKYFRATKQGRSEVPGRQRRVNEARLLEGRVEPRADFTS
jgi:hypothetical protein